MKSEKEINHEIRSIEATEYDFEVKAEKRQHKKDMARLKFLRHILAYLKTKPSKEFLQSEKKRLDKLISELMARYTLPDNYEMIEKKVLSKHKKDFETSYGIPKLRTQARTINFLLS